MRFLLPASLLLLVACGGETTPDAPAPISTPTNEPKNVAGVAPAAPAAETPPIKSSVPAKAEPSDGLFLPTSLNDPSVAAECAKPWPSVGGTWKSTPGSDSAKDRDVQAKLEGAQLALTFATSSVSREGQYESQNMVSFELPAGTSFKPGSYLQTRVSTAGTGWSCASDGRTVGGSYGSYSEDGPKWDLTITSRTDTRIEGSYDEPLPDESIQHTEFSAPIGDLRMGRPAVACCLGSGP